MGNVIDFTKLQNEREQKRIEEINNLDIHEEVQKLISQMEGIEYECINFWSSLSPQQRMMTFHVIFSNIFKSVCLDDVRNLNDYMKKYLDIDTDISPAFDIVTDSSQADVIFDMLLAGKDLFEKEMT